MSFNFVKRVSKIMDDYYVDPIVGLFPVVGDALPALLSIPAIYLSMFEIRSIPLTLAVVYNILLDVLIGMIPFLGNIFDIFNKAHRQNLKLIVGFVEDDREMIHSVNKKAIWMAVFICVLIYLIYLLVQLVGVIYNYIIGLF